MKERIKEMDELTRAERSRVAKLLGARGGKARAKNNPKEKLSEWGFKGTEVQKEMKKAAQTAS